MRSSILFLVILAVSSSLVHARDKYGSYTDVPPDIKAVFEKPLYTNSIWGLRVVDLDTQRELINLEPHYNFLIGSVRKIFTVGELLNEIGARHRYDTLVYRRGEVDRHGILHGDLILVASGDLTMGGRTNPSGTIAITNYDHNEADSLGNATLSSPHPLAGYAKLAWKVARSGITQVTGNVIIDDRLFQPFNFRGEFDVRPIFVNDDVVDVSINPTAVGDLASVAWRPFSAALGIDDMLVMSPSGSPNTFKLDPELPQCIGQPGCMAEVTGQLPIDFIPPLTNKYPWVQTIRIVKPSNYARTVFVEALKAVGVTVNAPSTAENPVQLLPPKNSYRPNTQMAKLKGLPYFDYAKFILKVSYNIGADTSLVLFGLTQGVDNINDALDVERTNLVNHYGIQEDEFHFIDGSGGGLTTATNGAVTKMLIEMTMRPAFRFFFDALPILGVDGSLAFVTDFQSDPTLAGRDWARACKDRDLPPELRVWHRTEGTGIRWLCHYQKRKTARLPIGG